MVGYVPTVLKFVSRFCNIVMVPLIHPSSLAVIGIYIGGQFFVGPPLSSAALKSATQSETIVTFSKSSILGCTPPPDSTYVIL